jgi:hypothetical protein
MTERWSADRAWDWYNHQPWLRGCNFMGSDCCNRIDQWQELGFEERLVTADRELALAAATGFNCIRLILQFEVWDQEHDGFMDRLDRYLATAAKHGITAMICFGNDCTVPKDDNYAAPKLGPQTVDWGYHGGRKNSPHDTRSAVGYSILDDPVCARRFYRMVEEVITVYAQDDRVVVWDLFNEPGNGNRGNKSLPYLLRFFEIAREINPQQPLTTGVWRVSGSNVIPEIEQAALDLSDVVSYHNYLSYDANILLLERLKGYGRPLFNTEWLHRIYHNNIDTLFPLFYLERVSCFNWGFVAGKYQTYEPWETVWRRHEAGEAQDVDFTKWQHDLFRPSLRPYDPKEIEIIRRYCTLADERDGRKE